MRFPEYQVRHDLTIRPATFQDLEMIGDLWVELMAFHAALDARFSVPPHGRANYIRHVQHALRDETFVVLVAVEQQQVVGYVMGYIGQNPPIFAHPRYGFIADLCVTSQCRRKGAGEALVKKICAWFRGRGMHSVQLNVAHLNPLSQAFWRKVGCADYLDHMWLELD